MLNNLKKFSLPEGEQKVLAFWKDEEIFLKSRKKRKKGKKFVFYEGPPTANGRPGIHHMLARAFKDVILRYKTMEGFSVVPRKGGWDTQGLPVELEVEKKLGLHSKKEIEEYGVSAFNKKCRESVWQYKDEWERLTQRMGFWIDLDHSYVTYENDYIETLWWIFRYVADKKLLYEGHKVMPWCPRCGTALSSHEVAQGYKEVKEDSVYVKFKMKKGHKVGSFETDDRTFILSWTTTPWTLPGNVALAVGEKIKYAAVRIDGMRELLILGEDLIDTVLAGHTIEKVYAFTGKNLLGLEYEPLFSIPFIKKDSRADAAYKIYPADFVTVGDGTGVVHTAVMYGEDDYNLGKKIGLPEQHTVNEEGRFVESVPVGLAGLSVKSDEVKEKIFTHLKIKKWLLKIESYTHEYPFCWRCGSALLYYARHSWFIRMSGLRKKLMVENSGIHWVPSHLQSGRFGRWIKEVKDWAISRERYWGTPLPIWQCDACGETKTIGGVDELDELIPKSGNRYIIMRHGEAENNTLHLINNWPEPVKLSLTEKGRKQVEISAKKLKKKKIDFVFASDVTRTKQTAEIVCKALEFPKVNFDKRLREFDMGEYNGRTYEEYKDYYASRAEKFEKRTPNGENFTDLRTRLYDFMREMEEKHKNKTILIITHDAPVYMLHSLLMGWSTKEALDEKNKRGMDYIANAGFEEGCLKSVSRDESGAFDLHRPYIDAMEFPCTKCKNGTMHRVPEVADVWFDSGAMPFAEEHWPFEQISKTKSQKPKSILTENDITGLIKKIDYPADYICEAMDQTRGWFYTLLAISTLLGQKAPYKNVISLGLILDKNGQKMSKSKGNIVSPWEMMEKYGIDVIRWYFYTVNPPGEPKRFNEGELLKVSRQLFQLLYNSFVFYETYADKDQKLKTSSQTSANILDAWALLRLSETRAVVSKNLDKYDVGEAAKAIGSFADDLSRWYIRRSRRRFQRPELSAEGKKDFVAASAVLRHALLETSKLLAPFAPFFAEALYLSLPAHPKLSVHLEEWGKISLKSKISNQKLLNDMKEVRDLASATLAKRAELGIKVRQPLEKLKIKNKKSKFSSDLLEILKDEVNVREIILDAEIKEVFELDTEITHELREEGWFRELTRTVQGLRQDAKLEPKDTMTLFVEASEELRHVIQTNEKAFARDIGAKVIEYKRTDHFVVELATKVDGMDIWLALRD